MSTLRAYYVLCLALLINKETFGFDIDQLAETLASKLKLPQHDEHPSDNIKLREEVRNISLELGRIKDLLLETQENQDQDRISKTEFKELSQRVKRAFSKEKIKLQTLNGELRQKADEMKIVVNELKENQVKFDAKISQHIGNLQNETESKIDEFDTLIHELKENQGNFNARLSGQIADLQKTIDSKIDQLEIMIDMRYQEAENKSEINTKRMSLQLQTETKTNIRTQFQNLKEEMEQFQAKTKIDMGQKFNDLQNNLLHVLEPVSVTVSNLTDQCVSNIRSFAMSQTGVQAAPFVSTISSLSNKMDESANKLDTINKGIDNLVELISNAVKDVGAVCKNNVYTKGRVRLVNVQETYSSIGGRLEVFYHGSWGTVCNDGFGLMEANVACHSLGFKRGAYSYASANFGGGEGRIWLDNVKCSGSETHIFNCATNRVGHNNCGHDEDEAIVCRK